MQQPCFGEQASFELDLDSAKAPSFLSFFVPQHSSFRQIVWDDHIKFHMKKVK